MTIRRRTYQFEMSYKDVTTLMTALRVAAKDRNVQAELALADENGAESYHYFIQRCRELEENYNTFYGVLENALRSQPSKPREDPVTSERKPSEDTVIGTVGDCEYFVRTINHLNGGQTFKAYFRLKGFHDASRLSGEWSYRTFEEAENRCKAVIDTRRYMQGEELTSRAPEPNTEIRNAAGDRMYSRKP